MEFLEISNIRVKRDVKTLKAPDALTPNTKMLFIYTMYTNLSTFIVHSIAFAFVERLYNVQCIHRKKTESKRRIYGYCSRPID